MPGKSRVTRRQLAALLRESGVVGPVSQAPCQIPAHAGKFPYRTLFDVFRNLTAPTTASFIPSEFWTREVLQLAHSEPAVWHATLALGALHQRHELYWRGGHGQQNSDSLWNQATKNYAQAITCAKNVGDPARLLSLSLALLSITNMMGRWQESQIHIMAGNRLMSQSPHDPVTESRVWHARASRSTGHDLFRVERSISLQRIAEAVAYRQGDAGKRGLGEL